MDFIFKNAFIRNDEVVFYVYLVIIALMIIFGLYKAFVEIKNEHK